MFKGLVKTLITPNVLDVQGQAVKQSLENMGFDSIVGIRVGRLVEVVVTHQTEELTREKLTEMAERLLINTVIEDYEIEVEKVLDISE